MSEPKTEVPKRGEQGIDVLLVSMGVCMLLVNWLLYDMRSGSGYEGVDKDITAQEYRMTSIGMGVAIASEIIAIQDADRAALERMGRTMPEPGADGRIMMRHSGLNEIACASLASFVPTLNLASATLNGVPLDLSTMPTTCSTDDPPASMFDRMTSGLARISDNTYDFTFVASR